MIVETIANISIDGAVVSNYFKNLVNQLFKILPMKENGESTLGVYLCTLRNELLGCKSLITLISNDSKFMSLLNIVQFLFDNYDTCEVKDVKREVFSAISLCNKICRIFSEERQ